MMRIYVLLPVVLVGNRKFLASFGTAGCQYSTAIGCSHALTETVFVISFTVVRLKCSFHDSILYYIYFLRNGLQN